jgi:hypothetical protein
VTPTPDRSYFTGLLTGLAAAAVVVHLWFAVLLAPLRDTYAELGADTIPPLTKVVISPIWLWGIPVAAGALVAGLIATRPRRLGPYAACALMLATTVVATWWCSQSPLREMADAIKLQP